MVRTDGPSVPRSEDQRDSMKQRATTRKKPVVSAIWPCKINGCNKHFAREADLKRHQRTTKLHSMPSYQCPQCDSNFTRTDALRRHQKSRHDGVVIEPVEQNKGGDENSDGRNRSGTPATMGKEKATSSGIQAPQGTGTSSYYRSHTVTITPHIPSCPSQDPTRPPPPWPGYPPNWQNGQLPPNMGYVPQPMYYPSPHYRPHTNGYHSGSSPVAQPPPPYYCSPDGVASSSSSSVAKSSRNSSAQPPNSTSPPSTTHSVISCIDPHLDSGSEITEADVVAAVQAVLLQAESQEAAKKEKQQQAEKEKQRRLDLELEMHIRSAGSIHDGRDDGESMHTHGELGMDNAMSGLHSYGSSLGRPEPMEHILTEDGEPMLNPAELLTQESLASPPPS